MHYIDGNILDSDRTIAHCVSEDFLMEESVSKMIKNRYGMQGINVESLHCIGWKFIGIKYIVYLIVKEKFWMKPTMLDMKRTIVNLRQWCQEHNIDKLAIPRIGCGLDRLYWNDIVPIIEYELESYGIDVDVYTP